MASHTSTADSSSSSITSSSLSPSPSVSTTTNIKQCSQNHSSTTPSMLTPGTKLPASTLIQYVRDNSPLQRYTTLNPHQSRAFELFWTSPLSTIQSHHTQRVDTLDVLTHFFNVFDALFFASSLHPAVSLSYSRDRTYDAVLGQTTLRDRPPNAHSHAGVSSEHGFRIAIDIISPARSFLRYSGYLPLKADVDVLLRQMCHAFLQLWLCEECTPRSGDAASTSTSPASVNTNATTPTKALALAGPSSTWTASHYEAAWQQLALVIEGNTWNDARFRGFKADLGITPLRDINANPSSLRRLEGASDLQCPEPVVLRESKTDDWMIVEREVVLGEIEDEEAQRLVEGSANAHDPASARSMAKRQTRRLQKPIPARLAVMVESEEELGAMNQKHSCRSCWHQMIHWMTHCGILPKQ